MNSRKVYVFLLIVASGVVAVDADQCGETPVWLVVLDAIVPIIGILTSGSYFCFVRCCTNHNKKILQKILRYISLVNFVVLLASIVLLILSCEKVLTDVFGYAKITEWVCVAAISISWTVMVVESYICRERWYIKNLRRKQEIMEKIQEIKDTQPTVFWTMVGYNVEDRQVPVRTLHLPFSTHQVMFTEKRVRTQTHVLKRQ